LGKGDGGERREAVKNLSLASMQGGGVNQNRGRDVLLKTAKGDGAGGGARGLFRRKKSGNRERQLLVKKKKPNTKQTTIAL